MNNQEQYLSIGKVSEILGVSVVTLRRWEKSGKLTSKFRTFGHHRRYFKGDIAKLLKIDEKKVICYSRVSSHDQKKDLIRQDEKLRHYCNENKITNVESILDLGSGLNFNKKGLKKLINMILNQEISMIILNHKERLLRFGSEILFKLCDFYHIKILILNNEVKDFNQDLTESVIEIMTVFCAKLYGKRSHKNKIK
jgi:predicted site-specific integrase-resolvase